MYFGSKMEPKCYIVSKRSIPLDNGPPEGLDPVRSEPLALSTHNLELGTAAVNSTSVLPVRFLSPCPLSHFVEPGLAFARALCLSTIRAVTACTSAPVSGSFSLLDSPPNPSVTWSVLFLPV
jgi:hypothetical protein